MKIIACAWIALLVACAFIVRPEVAFADDQDIIVVSFGDSYSSGEGCPAFYGQTSDKYNNEDWFAHRSTHSWSGQLNLNGTTLNRVKRSQLDKNEESSSNTRWYFYASSGAEARHIYSDEQPKNVRIGLSKEERHVCVQIDEAIRDIKDRDHIDPGEVDYVTMTIGGNDIGFTGIVSEVAARQGFIDRDYLFNALNLSWYKFDRRAQYAGTENNKITIVDDLVLDKNVGDTTKREEIKESYMRIADAFPNAKIVIAGYPTLLDDDEFEETIAKSQGSLWDRFMSWLGFYNDSIENTVGFASWEGWFINQNVHMFNSELSMLVSETNTDLATKATQMASAKAGGSQLRFVSVEELFAGHEANVKNEDERYLNNVMPTQSEDLDLLNFPPISSYSIHPNYREGSDSDPQKTIDGIGCYRKAVQAAIDEFESDRPLVVFLDSDDEDDKDARYAAYLKKVEEYQVKYGEGAVVDLHNLSGLLHMDGLCIVNLIDFDNDGDEELLLGFFDESRCELPDKTDTDRWLAADAYRAEVWGYENGSLVRLFESGFQWTNGGFAYLPIYYRDDDVAMYTVEYDTDADNRAVGTNRIWVLNGDAFEEVTTFSTYGMWGTGKVEYEIDGKSIDENEYKNHFDDVMGDYAKTSYWMTWNDESGHHQDERETLNNPDATLKITRETIKKLKGEPGDASEAWAQFPQSFTFTSGAGAWSTELSVAEDGTFSGYYHDSDMGDTGNGYPNGTRYETHFTGKFTTPVKTGDFEYSMQVERLEITDKAGERVEDGVRVVPVTDSVYGLGGEVSNPTGEYSLHLPGQSLSNLSDSAKSWLFVQGSKMRTINFYAIVNSSNSKGDLAFRTVEEFGEAEMAADDDENVLRSYVEANAGHDILYWFYEDFDNDGTYEAMAIAGVANNARNYEGEWTDGEIWYAGKDGGRQAGWPESGNALNGVVKDSKTGYSFLSVERDGHGSGSSSEVYVAKSDGCSVALFDVGTVGNFHEDNGRLIGYTQTMENGYHQYAWHEFEFHPDIDAFTSKGVFDVTDSRTY